MSLVPAVTTATKGASAAPGGAGSAAQGDDARGLVPAGLRIRGQDGFGGLDGGARRQGAALVGQQPADDRHHLGRRLALAEDHLRHPGARRAAVIQDGEVRRLAA